MSALDDGPLPTVRAAELTEPEPDRRWLVEPLWARSAVGILGGAPKCCKSWLALDMALSVATRTACLDVFDVVEQGDVLIYMAEDAPAVVRERLAALCVHRGLSLEDAPVHVITAPSIRLDRGRDQRRLRETVRHIAPRLLVLDPFVRLHRIDENHAGDVSALLAYLRDLQREHDLAVLVVHHAKKNGRPAQAGQALRGSGDFHAWGDSNLYLHRQRDQLALTVEHRAAPAPAPLRLELADDGDAHLAVVEDDAANSTSDTVDLEAHVLAALSQKPMSRDELRRALRVRNERLGHVLRVLHDADRLTRDGARWAVPVPVP